MITRRPAEILGDYCDFLRARLTPGDTAPVSPDAIPALVARFGRALLAQAPSDRVLADTFHRLSERGFTLPPPPPGQLPREQAGLVLARWSSADRAAVAAAIVVLPDPVSDPVATLSLFELLIRIPSELARARLVLDGLAAAQHSLRQPPPGAGPEDIALLHFRLSLAEHAAAATRPDHGQLLAPFRRFNDTTITAAAITLAASFELQHPVKRPLPTGLNWLVPVAGGTAVPGLALALARRPALGNESPRIIDWLTEAGPPAWLAPAEDADRRGDFAAGTRLLTEGLEVYATADETRAALAARDRLLCTRSDAHTTGDALFPLPAFASPEAPRSSWSTTLLQLFARDPLALENDAEAAIAETLGEARLVAEYRLNLKDPAAVHAIHLLGRERVRNALELPVPTDEIAIAKDPGAALIAHRLLPSGLERTLLSLRLRGAGIEPLGVSDDLNTDETPAPAAHPAAAESAPESESETSPDVSPDDPHHPAQRLLAARALLEAGQAIPAAAIVVALLRKTDRTPPPTGFFDVVAETLELDEPPADLTLAMARAIDDDRRNLAVLELLAARPLAAFGNHENLYDFAIDPSRPDARRLLAISAWLHIWVSSDTAPDELGVRRMRETDAPLLAIAAARLAKPPSVLLAAARFLKATSHLPDEIVARHLLELARGQFI